MEQRRVRPCAVEGVVAEGERPQIPLDPVAFEVPESCAQHAEREVHRDGVRPECAEPDGVATRSTAEVRDARAGSDPSHQRFDPGKPERYVARSLVECLGDPIVGRAIAAGDVVVARAQNVEIAQTEATIVASAVPPAPIPRSALFSPSPRIPKA